MLHNLTATQALISQSMGAGSQAIKELQQLQTLQNQQHKERNQSTEVRYYLCDHLGTPNALINQSGEIEWAAQLDAWGQVTKEYNPNNLYQPIRLPGQHQDQDTGLYYNRHRYYEPKLGRYINQDPIGLKAGFNKNTYVNSNPVQFKDVLGLQARIDRFGRSPESTGFNTVFCDGESLKIYLQEFDHEQCEGIKKCTEEHEESHLNGALASNPSLCQGNSARVIIAFPKKEALASEEKAFLKEIECLKKEKENTDLSICKSRYNSKINIVELIYKKQVLKGNYP